VTKPLAKAPISKPSQKLRRLLRRYILEVNVLRTSLSISTTLTELRTIKLIFIPPPTNSKIALNIITINEVIKAKELSIM